MHSSFEFQNFGLVLIYRKKSEGYFKEKFLYQRSRMMDKNEKEILYFVFNIEL